MSSALDTVIRGIAGQANRNAIEARLVDDVNVGLAFARRYIKYNVPEESRELCKLMGVPFFEKLVFDHPHPIHKIQFRQFHLCSLPSYLTTPTTICQVKKDLFDELCLETTQPLTLNNCIIEAEDLKRFSGTTNQRFPSFWEPISTPTAFFSDNLHHMDQDQVYSLFVENPALQMAYFRAVIPPEALIQDFSAQPDLYEFTIKDGVLTYYPERDLGRPYKQPASCVLWLLTSSLIPKSRDGPTLHVRLIESNGPWHVFSISYAKFAGQETRSFRGLELVTLPNIYRRKIGEVRVPRKLLRSMILYGRTVPKHQQPDLFAKVRQSGGILEKSSMPLDHILVLVNAVQEIMKREVDFNLETKFRRGIVEDIRYYTIGTAKAYTVDFYRRKHIRNFLALVHDGDGDLEVSTKSRYVRWREGCLGLADQSNEDPHWKTFWVRLVNWHKEDRRHSRLQRCATLNEALRKLSPQDILRCPHQPHEMLSVKAALGSRRLVSPREARQRVLAEVNLRGLIAPHPAALCRVKEALDRKRSQKEFFRVVFKDFKTHYADFRAGATDSRAPVRLMPRIAELPANETPPHLPPFPPTPPPPPPHNPPAPPPGPTAQQAAPPQQVQELAEGTIEDGDTAADLEELDEREMQYLADLLLDHQCDDDQCPNHTGPLLAKCDGGAPSRYTGPCHLCPQYVDGTPAGGASGYARYIRTALAARANLAVKQQASYETNIDENEQLSTVFPRTAGKRYKPTFAGKMSPMRLMHHPVTEEDCLLKVVLALKPSAQVDHQWEVLHRFSTAKTRKALLKENSMLNVYHLEILCLYYQLNVGLVIRDPAFRDWPVDYGVQEGPRSLVLLENSHFSVLQQAAPETKLFRTRLAKERHVNQAAKSLPVLLKDIALKHAAYDKRPEFKPYTVSWPRAEALVRAMRTGDEGTVLRRFGEEFVKEMENIAEQRTHKVAREVKVMVDYGDGGNGKSRPIMEALAQKKYHKDHLFQVVLYTTRLQQATARKLNLRAPCADGKGTPKHFCETWENAITEGNQCHLAVFDEISKFHPGYIDLYCALNPLITHVILLGDPKQNSHHTPGESPLNDTTKHMPEDQYFSGYCSEYSVGTYRTFQRLAKFMNIPTCSTDIGQIDHVLLLPEDAHPIVPSQKLVNDVSALMAKTADTSASSQGLDWDHVAIVINPTVASFPDVHMMWTALGRAKKKLSFVWQVTMDPYTTQKLNSSPFMSAILSHRYRQDPHVDNWKEVDWFSLMKHKMGGLYDKLRLPARAWTNLNDVDFSRYPMVPTGGRSTAAQRLKRFEELPSMVRAYYESHEVERPLQAYVEDEPEQLVHATTTHAERVNFSAITEGLLDRVKEKYEREVEFAGTYTQQFPDRPMASRHNPKQKRSDFQFRQDGRVDPTLIALHHTMKADDKASTGMGIKKRITLASRADNEENFSKASEETGPRMWSSLCQLMHWDENEVVGGYNEDIAAKYQKEHEENRKKVKTLAMLKNKEKDAEPEKHIFQMDLGFKQEVKIKEESEGTNAKASQTLVTVHDHMLMKYGHLGRFLADMILAQCPENVYIHLKRSPGQLHRYIRRNWKKFRKHRINDYEAFDQRQDGVALYLEIRLMRRYGVPAHLVNQYYQSKIGAFSWLGHFGIMRFTGEFGTFLFNTLFNMAYANLKYDLAGFVCLFGGDDSAFNGLPPLRPDWEYWEERIPLVSKTEDTETPTFVSWYLTPQGIFKSPKILFTRYHIHKALGDLNKVVLSYFYEFSFAARFFDDIHQYLDEEQAQYHSAMCSIFFRNKRINKSKVYHDTDKYLREEEEVEFSYLDKLNGAEELGSDMVRKRFEQMERSDRRMVLEALNTVFEVDEEEDNVVLQY